MDGSAAILIWQTFARGESMSEPRSNPELPIIICRGIGRSLFHLLNNSCEIASPSVGQNPKMLAREKSRAIGKYFTAQKRLSYG